MTTNGNSFFGALLVLAATTFAENPVVQTRFTADPAPMVWNDTVFLYTTHDEDDATGFKMLDWLLYTSTDLVNWTDRGAVASLNTFTKWGRKDNGAWAHQAIRRNGKFYLYVTIQLSGIGVLVSDSPYGPFVDPIGKPLVNNGGPAIDPSVFIDDDGQAYMYWGNPDAYAIKLNADMISTSGEIMKMAKIQSYQEGPWFYKRGGLYYMAFASTCCPEGIGYATASSPTGPWTFKGSIMDGNPQSSGNHPGIIDFKGKSYVFGLNYAINFSQTTVHRERRSVCAAELKYNADGTIPKLPWWGGSMPSPGVAQVGTFDPYRKVEAETMAWSQGVKTELSGEGGMALSALENGDFVKIAGVDFGIGARSFEARVASATSGGNIELRLGSATGTLIGTLAVAGTGGWQTWTTRTTTISGAEGVKDLYLVFKGGSGSLFNVNWWRFEPIASGVANRPLREGLTIQSAARGLLVRSARFADQADLVAPDGQVRSLGSGREWHLAPRSLGGGLYLVRVRSGSEWVTRKVVLPP